MLSETTQNRILLDYIQDLLEHPESITEKVLEALEFTGELQDSDLERAVWALSELALKVRAKLKEEAAN